MTEQTTPRTTTRHFTAFRIPSFARRFVPALLLTLAFFLPPLLAGGLGVARSLTTERSTTPPALNGPLPARPAHDPSRPTAVIVAGNTSTESSDLLGPYETLAASGAFNLYVVAPERKPAQLYPSDLSILPHYSFAEYDATYGGKADLVVVPYIQHTDAADAEVLTWIREQAAHGTTILSICAGAAVVADAGVLDGQTATTHRDTLATVERTHPEVHWVRGQRYVDSGQFISAAGVTSGVDATLYTLSRTFGRQLAEQTAAAIGYPHTRFLDDPTWINGPLRPLPFLQEMYRVNRHEIGLLLYDGVRELEVASVVDTYPRSFSASVRTLSPEQTIVRTRHGLDLIPRSAIAAAPALDRVLVPGDASAPGAVAVVRAWTAQYAGQPVQAIHASGDYLYDATLRDMARHTSNAVTIEAANLLEYPTHDLHLDGPPSRLDLLVWPLALGLLGLGGAAWIRRRPRPGLRSTGRFMLHFAEMTLAMFAGMAVFHILAGGHGSMVADVSASAAHQVGMLVSMTAPMVAWMRLRGHSWRHGTEMALAMLAPAVATYALLGLGAGAALPWLQEADHPAMLLGMLGAMLLRREHYLGGHRHAAVQVPALG